MNLRAASDGRAEWVGFSRWLNNPNVTANEIAVHSAEVLSDRVAGLHVLAIQDTTELNYARHARRVRGLGPSGNGRDPGLFVHPVLAIDAGSGALLGLAGMQIWTRQGPASPDYRRQPIEEKETKKGGIIIPDTAKEKPQEGNVVALGTGKVDDNGKKVEFTVKKGDKVLISKYGGTEIKVDGESYLIMREDDILGIIG